MDEARSMIKKMRADNELLRKEKEEALQDVRLKDSLLHNLRQELPPQRTNRHLRPRRRKKFSDLSELSHCTYNLA